jgi:hypothetical protein
MSMTIPLFPTIPNPPPPTTSTRTPITPRAFLPTVKIDWNTSNGPDWNINMLGQIGIATRAQGWAQDGIVASLTQRGAHPVFPLWFGWDIERALLRPTRAQVEADIRRGITYAWTRCTQGRTVDVQQFAFEWRGDQVIVSFLPIPTADMGLRGVRLEVTY